jgi:flavodoxin
MTKKLMFLQIFHKNLVAAITNNYIRLAATVIFLLANASMEVLTQNKDAKILIVYYSWSGNTKMMANEIKSIVGGDMFEIIPAEPYPDDYMMCVEQAAREMKNNFRPKIVGTVKDFKKYDMIFVGSPNWLRTIAPPVATFLTEYDFSNKTVIPFCTHGGGGKENVFTDMEKMLPNSKVLKGLEVYCKYEGGLPVMGGSSYNSKEAVEKWLRSIGMLK